MRKRLRFWSGIALLAICSVSFWLFLRPPADPIIQGKRESEWIKTFFRRRPTGDASVQIKWEQQELQQWRALGPQGIEMLCRALDKGSGRFTQMYLGFYNKLNPKFQRCLPKPVDTLRTRGHAAYLLGELAKESKDVAVPALVRALKKEQDSDIRLGIIAFLNDGALHGREKERLEVLPDVIKAAQDSNNWILRECAYSAMRMYPDKTAMLIPILTNALSEQYSDARWNALQTLHELAPDVAKPQIVQAITNMFHDQEEEFFLPGRIEFLGEMRKDALPAVPALLDILHSTNAAIAQAAQNALMKIAPEVAEKAGVK